MNRIKRNQHFSLSSNMLITTNIGRIL